MRAQDVKNEKEILFIHFVCYFFQQATRLDVKIY